MEGPRVYKQSRGLEIFIDILAMHPIFANFFFSNEPYFHAELAPGSGEIWSANLWNKQWPEFSDSGYLIKLIKYT